MTTNLFIKPISNGRTNQVACEFHLTLGQPLPCHDLVDAVAGVLAQFGISEKLNDVRVARNRVWGDDAWWKSACRRHATIRVTVISPSLYRLFDTVPWLKNFFLLQIFNFLYFCRCKRGEIRLPRESAFSPYSAVGKLGHFTDNDAGVRENDCLLDVYLYSIQYLKWSNSYSLSASLRESKPDQQG